MMVEEFRASFLSWAMAFFFLLALLTLPAQAEQAENDTLARPTVALALGGGAVRGAAHIGVIRVLEKQGIPIDYIAGNSMGAIVGGLYAAGLSVDEIERRLLNKSLLRHYDTIPLQYRIALSPILAMPRLVGVHPYEGLYRGNRFAAYINKAVPPERRQIENSKIPFCAVACNLLDGKIYKLTYGNIGKVLQASSAIPVYRKPVPLNGKLFADGGVLNNLPIAQAREFKADLVIAVDVDSRIEELPAAHFRKIGSVTNRTVDLVLDQLDEPQRRAADIVIRPEVTGITLFVRTRKSVVQSIQAGEKAALAAMPAIQEALKKKQALLARP